MAESLSDPANAATQAKRHAMFKRAEYGIAIVLTVAVLFLSITAAMYRGGLWRDEVNSVEIASQPTLGAMWSLRAYDSCPELYHLILRVWMTICGDSSASFRTLGVIAT